MKNLRLVDCRAEMLTLFLQNEECRCVTDVLCGVLNLSISMRYVVTVMIWTAVRIEQEADMPPGLFWVKQ
jgi:hypothetical protein